MLINVKMPTIVGILTFMSMINTTWASESKKVFTFSIFDFRGFEFSCLVELSTKKVL